MCETCRGLGLLSSGTQEYLRVLLRLQEGQVLRFQDAFGSFCHLDLPKTVCLDRWTHRLTRPTVGHVVLDRLWERPLRGLRGLRAAGVQHLRLWAWSSGEVPPELREEVEQIRRQVSRKKTDARVVVGDTVLG